MSKLKKQCLKYEFTHAIVFLQARQTTHNKQSQAKLEKII